MLQNPLPRLINAFTNFSYKHPALVLGLGAYLGYSPSIVPFLLLFGPIFFLPRPAQKLLFFAFILFLFFFLKTNPSYLEGSGSVHFHINHVAKSKTTFGEKWVYRGKVIAFNDKPSFHPCQIQLPIKWERHPADCDYLIKGRIKGNRLYVSKKTEWEPIPGTFSLAEWRYQMKNRLAEKIKGAMKHADSGTFLAGLATGDFDDPALVQEFNRFGLQHIMAISGFHFSIIATILSLLLGIFIPRKPATLLLMFALSSYFLLLGLTASVLRAWVMIAIALGNTFAERRVIALNSLGVALLAVMAIDPAMSLRIGFLYSFGITAAILLFYTPIDQMLQTIFPKRLFEKAAHLPKADQWGMIFLNTIRQGLSLTLAVHLIAFPLTLYFFQRFPCLSLFYNLFFPFAVSLSMLLLILGSVLPFLHPINDLYTHHLLSLTYNIPISMDFVVRTTPLSSPFIVTYVSLIIFLGFFLAERKGAKYSAILY